MIRLTQKREGQDGYFVNRERVVCDENGCTGEAITRLAKFENALDELLARQNETVKEMDRLRDEEKTKSVRFRELLANKMMNGVIIALFERNGIE